LPVWLQAAGYYTSHIGKYLGGYGQETSQTLVPPGWTNWQGLVDPSTYKLYDYTINDNGTLVRYGTATEDYQTDVLADRAVETIDEAALSGQPFFLSIAPVPPNEERDQAGNRSGPRPAPRHVGAFGNEPLPKPPSFNESDVSDKPSFIRKLPRLSSSQIQNITRSYRDRLASLLAVDDLVERVVDQLSAAGVLDNTVLIFTSDNGWFMGEHRIASGHNQVYEEAIRVPLLIRSGSGGSGATTNQFVSNVDLAPTIVDLANATAGLPMDGQSLVPWVSNPGNVSARTLLIEAPGFKAVRNRNYVYVEHNSGARELYDMRQGTTNYDPYQLRSRHAASGYSQARSQLATKLNQLRNCAGSNCIVP
ncbi:MAG: sulfatase, partial [Pseudomonadota bacterium]|nr:sulfatase [Pseudomonadota bacterium]